MRLQFFFAYPEHFYIGKSVKWIYLVVAEIVRVKVQELNVLFF